MKDIRTIPPPNKALFELPSRIESPFILRCYIPSDADEETEDSDHEERQRTGMDSGRGSAEEEQPVEQGNDIGVDDTGVAVSDSSATGDHGHASRSLQADVSPLRSVVARDVSGQALTPSGTQSGALAREVNPRDLFGLFEDVEWDQSLLDISMDWD